MLHDHIRPLSLARDDGFVGDGFVGIAGQSGGDPIASGTDCQTCPTEVDLPFDGELETKLAVLYALPAICPLSIPLVGRVGVHQLRHQVVFCRELP